MAVTVPGSAESIVTLTNDSGDVLKLGEQIGALLSSIQIGDNLSVTPNTVSGALPPAPTDSSISELLLSHGSDTNVTIPDGWNYVVDDTGVPTTLTGANVSIVTGTVGSAVNVSGNSTVAGLGGNNTVSASGTYVLSFGPGDNAIFASGAGTVASGVGTSTVVATSAPSSGNLILSNGTGDLIVSSTGDNTVQASGSNTGILGGSGSLVITISGSNDTISSGAAATSITASTNAIVFGGTGPLTFVGGEGTPTIVGGTNGTEQITSGNGGVVFSVGQSNAGTVIGGAGTATLFGGADSALTYNASAAGGIFVAGAGNETLNAAGSSTSNFFSGGSDTGSNVRMIGGSGSDTMIGGAGSSTMTGGQGADAFAFFADAPHAHNATITDFAASDSLFLANYDTTKATFGHNANGALTLTLSDATQITFSNLTDSASLNGHLLNVKH